jgi:hypothetical protein
MHLESEHTFETIYMLTKENEKMPMHHTTLEPSFSLKQKNKNKRQNI